MSKVLILIWIGYLLTGCFPSEVFPTPTAPIPTSTITVTPLPTETIIWFPATATFTPFPTQEAEPTQDLRPGLGDIALEDKFTDTETWVTSRTDTGSVAFGDQELTLAISAPQVSLISFRKSLQISDFYLEIDALPSLCKAGDMYGLLLRVNSTFDYYRLMVNCIGQLRMERVRNGKYTPLQDWTSSGQVFPGGMIRNRLGVWALKDEMRVFVNNVHQFTVRDPVWQNGQVGLFARSAGETPLTVSFSNLMIYHLDQSQSGYEVNTPSVEILNTSVVPKQNTSTPSP